MTLLHNWQTAPTDDHPLIRLGRLLQNAGYQFTTISPPSHRRVTAREHHATAGDLRGVFGFMGLPGVEVICAEGVATGPENREKALNAAIAQAAQLSA